MAFIKISQLPSATAPTGAELVPLVQGGVTSYGLVSQIGAYVRGLFTTTPAMIAEGGTGAATAAAALTSLGGIGPSTIHAATSKGTPVGADELPLLDSASSFSLAKLTWANLQATLKTYFDTLYGATTSSAVRQTVLSGATSSGLPSALSVGSGLAVNLSATATPMVLSAAKGFGASGASDQIELLNADVTGVVTLPASNQSYIYRAIASAWGSTLAPPQYGTTYNQAAQSCLSLNNVSTDDFGNSWSNTSVTFANTTPKYSGTYYGVFNGTTSKMVSSAFTSLGNGGWAIRMGFYSTSIATAQILFNCGNASGYGVYLQLGVSKLDLYLSSNGTTWDIANALSGNTTLTGNTWYDVELTYDPVAGKYFCNLNGNPESNLTITSALTVCAFTSANVGMSALNTLPFVGNIQGFEILPYCKHPNGTAFTPQTALANVAAAGYASDWFSTVDYKMYSVSAASASAGTNPTFTSSAKVYAGQAVTGAATVTSVTNYAYQGKYDASSTTTATLTSKNHNIGVIPTSLQLFEAGVTAYKALTPTTNAVSWTAAATTSRLVISRGW